MTVSRRDFIATTAVSLAAAACPPGRGAAARDRGGRFEAAWESLRNYTVPQWYRDAKFGIWAHWTAQCVPEQGDWYARQMYMEGDSDYKYQCEHYGHPSKVG